MLTNYFKIALRTLRKHTGYAFINIAGLAVGLAACLLIGLYVHDEVSYDDFHAHADRTYRVLREFDIPDLHVTIQTTPPALASALKESMPAVEAAVRVNRASPVVERGTQKFVEADFIVADVGFFEMFSFPVLHGEASLDRPGTLVLTKAMATKYFAEDNPVGQNLLVGNDALEVVGVIADVPANSHLQFGFVSALEAPEPNWGLNNFLTYVLLREGASPEAVTPQIADLIRLNTDPEDEREGNDFIPHLQPITGIHLGQGVAVDIGSQGNILYVYLFTALAAFIVLLACINFMNLATARSAERAREVGMRKTLGARRVQLAAQFLGESVLMTALALVLALVLCQLTLPLLNNLADKSLAFSTLYNGPQALILVGLALLVGLVAGAYPALVLSGFQPSRVLKGAALPGGGDQLRKGLVVFQFAISIALLVGTGVVQHQLGFMKSAGLGFDADNVVLIEQANFLGSQRETFKQQIAQVPGVEAVTSGFSMPGTFFINSMWQPVASEEGPETEAQNMDYSFVDFDYTETLGIEIVAGRSLSQEFATDSSAAILNEAAVRDFGWSPEEAIGQRLAQGQTEYTVIGVAKDFHYRSLHAEIYSLALFGPRRAPRYVAARIAPEDMPGTLAALQGIWKQFSDLPFEYAFLADDLAAQYRAEDRLAKVFGVFAGLAILIGCLGLFGLAAFMAAQRTKEIGIRKVLGASVGSLIGLLSKDFLNLVVLAFLIAAPVAYFAMNWWLEDFAYRVEISWPIFLMAGSLALAIALLTVSYQAIRAAVANPVESLRYE
jgi:putative ABC transport system permease protein